MRRDFPVALAGSRTHVESAPTGHRNGFGCHVLSNPHFLRIATNYLRMLIGFTIGLALMQMLLGFGPGVFAAVALTGSSIGVAEILKEMIRGATIPELGLSYHGGDGDRFARTYASTLALSMLAALFSVAVLFVFLALLPAFDIAEDLRGATAFFIVTRMVSTFVAIAASPILNMMPITGRMAAYNGWLALDRIAEAVAALAVYLLFSGAGGAVQLSWFGGLSMVTMTASTVAAALWSLGQTPQHRPDLRLADRGRVREVFRTVGWNGAAVVSVNFYLRLDVFAVNLLFGVSGTVIFGLASQLAAYARMLTMGLVTGLDAVVSGHASGGETGKAAILRISERTFELQSLILFAAGGFLILHADDLVRLLFSWTIRNEGDLSLIASSFLMLMAGMIARGLSEGWMGVLAGAGHIPDYAKPVFLGSLLNPALVVAVGLTMPETAGLIAVSAVFMALNIVFHMGAVPWVTARVFGTSFAALLRPAAIPAATAAMITAVLWLATPQSYPAIVRMALSGAAFGLVMGTMALRSFARFIRQPR